MTFKNGTKRCWIVDSVSHFIVERHGPVFQFQLRPTERNGFTSVKEARTVMYRAKKELRAPWLQLMVVDK